LALDISVIVAIPELISIEQLTNHSTQCDLAHGLGSYSSNERGEAVVDIVGVAMIMIEIPGHELFLRHRSNIQDSPGDSRTLGKCFLFFQVGGSV